MGNIAFKNSGHFKEQTLQFHKTKKKKKTQCASQKQENTKNMKNKKNKEPKKNKKNMKMALVPVEETFLPIEVITEILSWLPVKSLLRCKCVCKEWYALLQDPHFIRKHQRRVNLAILSTEKFELETSNGNGIIGETFKFLYLADGLVVERSDATHKCRVRNPATRQILDLPSPHRYSIYLVICFDDGYTGLHKLVSIYSYRNDTRLGGCEILSLGSDDLSWRPLDIPYLYDFYKSNETVQVVSYGSLHCVRFDKAGSNVVEVVSIDLASECSTLNTLPQDLFSDLQKVEAISWNGNLSFFEIVKEELNVLALEDYKKHKFGEMKRIPLTFMNKDDELARNPVPVAAEGDCVWFNLNDKEVLAYDMEQKKILTISSWAMFVRDTCGDCLLTFKGMQPQKQKEKKSWRRWRRKKSD